MHHRNLWIGLAAVLTLSFAVLLYYGGAIYREAPPVPERVIATGGTVVMTAEDILDGQNVWQSMGGHELGSIWGHGSYVAPDWTADWLHREAELLLDQMARRDFGATYGALTEEQQAQLRVRLRKQMRANMFDQASGELSITPARARAFEELAAYYSALFGDSPRIGRAARGIRDPGWRAA